jgi:Bacteriocin-protection, YdeI or OmpD-Associated
MAQTLIAKLRIKPGIRIAVLNAPEAHAGHPAMLPDRIEIFNSLRGSFDQIHLFVLNSLQLTRFLPAAVNALHSDGLLWVFFPKKTSAAQSDLTRDRGWEPVKKAGLSGVSLISLDETWSAFAFRRRGGGAQIPARPARRGAADGKYIDRTKHKVRPPEDLAHAFGKVKGLAAKFDALAWTHQKEYVEWILGAKRAETHAKRVRETIDRLQKGLKNPSDKG